MANSELPGSSKRFKWLWWLLAYVSLALGLIGIIIPGLPTVPFVLLSAYAAARGSSRLHAWLHAHRTFGPMINDWERNRAVSRRAKKMASFTMLISGLLMLWLSPKLWMALVGCSVMALVATWLWFRPEK